MRASTTSTTWTCDDCGTEVVLSGGYQNTPPKDWRLLKLLPVYVNMALQPNSENECKLRVVCGECFTGPGTSLEHLFREKLGGG